MITHSNLNARQVIRLKGVISLTQLSRSTIYDKLNPKSPRYDASFPAKVPLGARAIGWYEAEICNWLESQRSNAVLEQSEGEV